MKATMLFLTTAITCLFFSIGAILFKEHMPESFPIWIWIPCLISGIFIYIAANSIQNKMPITSLLCLVAIPFIWKTYHVATYDPAAKAKQHAQSAKAAQHTPATQYPPHYRNETQKTQAIKNTQKNSGKTSTKTPAPRTVHAIMEVRIKPEHAHEIDRIAERITRFDEVEACHKIPGGRNLLVFVRGAYTQKIVTFAAEKLPTIETLQSSSILRYYMKQTANKPNQKEPTGVKTTPTP
jgi:DNA-binding Lrp family transcriptional regulator